ncbi:MAG: hypothetical protein H5T62_17620, partial [Anaerolineae bacterium]|nr:hypothetical protein [Anaerolineae bacterium]
AEPDNILQALRYYKGRPLESIRSVSILDPLRLAELFQVLTPLISKQLTHAELALINKADLATPEQIAEARRIVEGTNPHARVAIISARESLTPATLMELMPWIL